jgi:hypothetical protein
LLRGKLYKVHFRVYAAVVFDAAAAAAAEDGDGGAGSGDGAAGARGGRYGVHVCRLFKLYHSKAPYEPAGTRFDATVSKYLAHRLGNQVLAPAFIDRCFAEFVPIIRDTGTTSEIFTAILCT